MANPPEHRRFTPEEIEYVARLQAGAAPRNPVRFVEGAVFAVLVSADVGMWTLVAWRGLREMVG